MTTMSDEGDRMCPLCAEDMDLTDQQLKPCKCGYEICVWCWHHIIDMAEKDDMEGRCPACRSPYDKERIVGMAANCGRMVAEINAEKKQKSQKAKPKTSVEAKRHLSGVRVIQRNLVYIVGLPSNLCDETLLQRREFFGQYGKVLKVSVSRPASPSGQQASNNNTCSGYITYAKEEEAVRCIQAVHNFVLEGKPLRACFGTTKYCHAWLRNMICSNPDCLYLHDIGSQEDSFTKDEIISAYTRSRVPQIASNNLQRRLGSVLPPPVDDFSNCGTVSGKQVLKSAANNTVSQIKAPPNGIVGKPAVLPAAASWGLRVSNGRTSSMSCSQSSLKQKVDTATSACLISSVNESTKQMSPCHVDPVIASRLPERRRVIHSDGICRPIEPTKPGSRMDCRSTISDVSSEVLVDAVCTPADSAWNDDVPTESTLSEERYAIHLDSGSRSLQTQRPGIGGECQTSGSNVLLGIVPDAACTSGILISFSSSPPPASEVKDRCITVPLKDTSTVESTSPQGLSRRPISSGVDAISYDSTGVNGHIQSLCFGLSSVNIDSHLGDDYLNIDQHQSSSSNLRSTGMPGNPTLRLQQRHSEHGIVCLASTPLRETSISSDMHISDWSSESQKQVSPSSANEMNDSLAAGDEQVHRLPGVTNQTSHSSYLSQSLNITNNSNNSFWRNDIEDINPLVSGDSSIMDKKFNNPLSPFKDNELTLSSRHKDEDLGSYSNLGRGFDPPESCTENVKCLRRLVDVANIDETACMDMGESQIVSDILSLDFDPWDDSLSSDNNFAKLLCESRKKDESFNLLSSHRLQNSDQSRFSFARQENLASTLESSLRDSGHSGDLCSSLKGSSGDGVQNVFLSNAFECPKPMTDGNPTVSSDRISGVSRAKISAPPGFSMPSKAPPPGFSLQDRYDQAQGATYSGDVEFIDPAILAVGKGCMPLGVNNSSLGLRPAFPAHFSTLENDLRLQLLMQQSMSSHQNLIADHIGDRFLAPNDAFITSQLLAQNCSTISPFSQMSLQQPRNSYISSNQWDDWNLQTGNDAGMAEILRNEIFRLNNYFPESEEHKFYIPSSGDLYSRAFGM